MRRRDRSLLSRNLRPRRSLCLRMNLDVAGRVPEEG